MDHIDESAELYALGLLDAADRERIDEHARACDPCARRLGEAENAVTALVVASQRVPQRAQRWPLAVAAAFALASGALLAQNVALRGALGEDGTLAAALARSHFAHAQFHAADGKPIDAKVIYDRRGGWFEILSVGAVPAHVRITRADGAAVTLAQPFVRRGDAALLFARDGETPRELQMLDAQGRPIASVRPLPEAE